MALIQIQEPGQNSNQITQEDQEEQTVIGIDLGTTNSLVTIIENDQVRFLQNNNKEELHPSIVSYDKNGQFLASCGDVIDNDQNIVIHSIKRLMGKDIDDVNLEQFNFKFSQDKALELVIGDNKINCAEISAKILEYLKNIAQNSLKKDIKQAVITVPAYFDEAAKNATKLAANLAGLEVLRLVNEPTAAALAYGLDQKVEGTYCVYDLGGGTFDVSILKMQKGVFKTLGVAGDNNLGGDDFDNIIAKNLKISKSTAKKIKEQICNNQIVNSLTKENFEELIAPILNKTFSLTQNLIDDLDLETNDIKGIILVGGSSRIPLISQKLGEIFGKDKILNQIDPDRIVAAGAAWQAYNLSSNSNNLLLDVNALSLGVEMMGGIVDKLIYRNSTIPTAITKEFTTYADFQTGLKLHIVQGERELAKDCRSLAKFEIKNIPAMKAGIARIAVTFKLDADGLLTVSAKEKHSQTIQEITVKPSYGLEEQDVKNMLFDSLKNSQSDIEKRLMIETINEANKDIAIIKNDLKNFSQEIDPKDLKSINNSLQSLEKLIQNKKPRQDIQEALKDLQKSSENLILHKVNLVLNQKISGKNVDDVVE